MVEIAEKIEDGNTLLQIVTFKIGDEEFSVDILKVNEIIRMTEITRVPRVPESVEGVINLRGRIIPILDLRKRFGLSELKRNGKERIIIIESRDKIIGLIVDSVSEVMRIPVSAVEPAPDIVKSFRSEYVEGVCKAGERLIVLLNLDKVLTSEERESIEDMTSHELGQGAQSDRG